ncbi:MAG: hypothetical protein V3T73_02135 [Dehalococcoidales bacterium]|jgi:hypothetical protein
MKEKAPKKVVRCNQCGKPAITMYTDEIPLCVDCYGKVAQADFVKQQARHNQMSWLASQLNLTQQYIYQGSGGLLPLKQMAIPQPPLAGINYSYSNIQVSDSAVGVINPGTLYTIDTSIDVMQSRGENELAAAIQKLTQEVVNSNEIQNDVKKEIAELLQFLASTASADKDARNKSVVKQVLERLGKLIPAATLAWSIWEKVQPLLESLGD